MKRYCCRELHQLEDDSWAQWFGFDIIEKDGVEVLCMDEQVILNVLMNILLIFVLFVEVN